MPKVTFDGSTKRIHVNGGVTAIDVEIDLYSDWKEWVLTSALNAGYPQAFRTFGGDSTVGTQSAPKYFFLTNGWRIVVDGLSLVVATNLYTDEGDSPFILQNNASVSLSNSDVPVVKNAIQDRLDYDNAVFIDAAAGSAGTSYPSGTSAQPVNTFADAATLGAAYAINTFKVNGTLVLAPSDAAAGGTFIGDNPVKDILVLQGGDTTYATVNTMTVTGAANGRMFIHNGSIIAPLSNFSGGIVDCLVTSTITVDPTFNDTVSVLQSGSGVPGLGSPVIDMNGAPANLQLRDYSGSMKIQNFNQGMSASFDFLSGKLLIDSSCTLGTIVVRGNAKVVDATTGLTLQSGTYYGGLVVHNETVDPDDTRNARKLSSNRAVISADRTNVKIYDDDGTTLLHEFTVSPDQLERTPQ